MIFISILVFKHKRKSSSDSLQALSSSVVAAMTGSALIPSNSICRGTSQTFIKHMLKIVPCVLMLLAGCKQQLALSDVLH